MQNSKIASRAIVAAPGISPKGTMAPVTHSEGVPTAIVGISLNPAVMKRALCEADILVPVGAPSSSRKLTRLHTLIDCGDWIYEYIRLYVNEVKCLYLWIRNNSFVFGTEVVVW
jgi:hypothetical protein